MNPVVESEVALLANTSINADGKDHEANDGDDFDTGKPKLNFAVTAHRQQVDGCEDDPEDTDPNGNVEVGVPVLDNKSRDGKLEGECDGPGEPVDPSHGKSEGRVDKAGSVHGEGTGDWQIGGHLTEGNHEREDDGSNEEVCNQTSNRTGDGQRTAASNEETSTNGSAWRYSQRRTLLRKSSEGCNVPMAIIWRWRLFNLLLSSP